MLDGSLDLAFALESPGFDAEYEASVQDGVDVGEEAEVRDGGEARRWSVREGCFAEAPAEGGREGRCAAPARGPLFGPTCCLARGRAAACGNSSRAGSADGWRADSACGDMTSGGRGGGGDSSTRQGSGAHGGGSDAGAACRSANAHWQHPWPVPLAGRADAPRASRGVAGTWGRGGSVKGRLFDHLLHGMRGTPSSVMKGERDMDARRCPGPLWHCIVRGGSIRVAAMLASVLVAGPSAIGVALLVLFSSHPVG